MTLIPTTTAAFIVFCLNKHLWTTYILTYVMTFIFISDKFKYLIHFNYHLKQLNLEGDDLQGYERPDDFLPSSQLKLEAI